MDFDVGRRAKAILSQLASDPKLGRFVDPTLGIPEVAHGRGDIRLIVLGQDPTVKDPRSRASIKTVLNLDKRGGLRTYLSRVCIDVGLNLDENVYATNYLKNFFVSPPTQIEEIDAFEVFGPIWFPLLHDELALFPQVPVITLGQPLLAALVYEHAAPRVRDYWGYTPDWKSGETAQFHYVESQYNRLGRTLFPFPHQPSIRKQFYKERLSGYSAFVRTTAL